jgi:carboxyl-terminal processing protease
MPRFYVKSVRLIALGLAAAAAVSLSAQAPPTMPVNDLLKARNMLRESYEIVQKEYYDPKFHGLDLAARFKEYDEKLKTAPSMSVGLTLIAAFLDGLQDSHTSLQPPERSYSIDYGYRLAVIGNDVFVERVRPDTDAASKVLPGDRLVSLNGNGVSRDSFHRMQYLLQVLQPQQTTRLVVQNPQGAERTISVETKITPGRVVRDLFGAGGAGLQDLELRDEAAMRLMRSRHVEQGGVMIWKMPAFFADNGEIDRLFAVARKQKALILDLRGNPGGIVDTLRRVVSNLFGEDVTLGTRVTRKGKAALTAKTRGADVFTGQLIVLVDAGSASCSELLARVVQLGKRGTVIGDRSAGAVMEARVFQSAQLGAAAGSLILYGFSVTSADILMADGRSLEKAGVTPDELLLPTGQDLALGRDPVMTRAAKLAGLDLDPVAAGKLFPFEWK